MANPLPSPVSFSRAVYLCLLLLLFPEKFRVKEEEDNRVLNSLPSDGNPPTRSLTVRRAFLYSALLVFIFGAIGYFAGLVLGACLTCAKATHIAWLQVVGASLLLWGTLFVRGWEIQTRGGVTLTERVNQWLYRFLYCVGTAVIVSSLSWPQCANTG